MPYWWYKRAVKYIKYISLSYRSILISIILGEMVKYTCKTKKKKRNSIKCKIYTYLVTYTYKEVNPYTHKLYLF